MNPLLKVNPPRPGLNPLKGKVNPLREILSKQCNKSRAGWRSGQDRHPGFISKRMRFGENDAISGGPGTAS